MDAECQNIWAKEIAVLGFFTVRPLHDARKDKFLIETNDARSFESPAANMEYLFEKDVTSSIISTFVVTVAVDWKEVETTFAKKIHSNRNFARLGMFDHKILAHDLFQRHIQKQLLHFSIQKPQLDYPSLVGDYR